MAKSRTPLPDAEALGTALDANHLQAKAEIAEATCFSANVPAKPSAAWR